MAPAQVARLCLGRRRVGSLIGSLRPPSASADSAMVLPPLSMDLGLLLISIGVVNLWRMRQNG